MMRVLRVFSLVVLLLLVVGCDAEFATPADDRLWFDVPLESKPDVSLGKSVERGRVDDLVVGVACWTLFDWQEDWSLGTYVWVENLELARRVASVVSSDVADGRVDDELLAVAVYRLLGGVDRRGVWPVESDVSVEEVEFWWEEIDAAPLADDLAYVQLGKVREANLVVGGGLRYPVVTKGGTRLVVDVHIDGEVVSVPDEWCV